MIYTREEDIQHDMYRPLFYDRISAGLDAQGKPVGWSHRIAGSSIVARFFPAFMKNGVDPDAVRVAAEPAYAVGDESASNGLPRSPRHPDGVLARGWRDARNLVVESFIDELAANESRIRSPTGWRCSTRVRGRRPVLQLAADKASWGKPLPAGQGRGIALCTGFGSYIAQVVEVTVDKDGTVSPTRVVCAVDCGLTVNPDTVRAQMESGIVFGLSGALFGEITLKDGRVEQTSTSATTACCASANRRR
ncbi:MAG: molybdopterin cofactor-binding domain-containing protein [Burkholderiales bacterium]